MLEAQPAITSWPIKTGGCHPRRAKFAGLGAARPTAKPTLRLAAAVESVVLHRLSNASRCARRKAMNGPNHTKIAPKVAPRVAEEITRLLERAFAPTSLEVINDSASHHGHAGHDGSGESHFTVDIESAAFSGISRLQRQRMVNAALGDIPGQRVHALAIRARTPGE
jgi:BolA protein